jgi:hypothetical protein
MFLLFDRFNTEPRRWDLFALDELDLPGESLYVVWASLAIQLSVALLGFLLWLEL